MKILIADDDNISLHMLDKLLLNWNYSTVKAENGIEAWNILKSKDSPEIGILD